MIPSVVLNLSQASITQFLDNSLSHSWSLILSERLQYKGKDENKSAISFCLENLQKVWHCVIWGEKSLALAAMVYIFRCIMKIFPSRPCMRIELCWFNVSPGRIYTTQLPPAIMFIRTTWSDGCLLSLLHDHPFPFTVSGDHFCESSQELVQSSKASYQTNTMFLLQTSLHNSDCFAQIRLDLNHKLNHTFISWATVSLHYSIHYELA